jgi:hypothetical protein
MPPQGTHHPASTPERAALGIPVASPRCRQEMVLRVISYRIVKVAE